MGLKDLTLYEKRGKTAIITLNYPEKMNIYGTKGGTPTLQDVLPRALDDDEVWTIIITGAGDKAFCAGLDLKTLVPDSVGGPRRGPTDRMRVEERITRMGGRQFHLGYLKKPTIAAINGYCVGGGLEIICGCDIRIAAEHATFESSEIKRGNLPGITPGKLPRLIGYWWALELLLTCRRITAQESYRIGLVNEVVPLAELMPRALAVADEINENAPLSVRAAKEVAYRGLMSLTTSDAIEEASRWLHEILPLSEDYHEGARAFMEKRKPVWKAR